MTRIICRDCHYDGIDRAAQYQNAEGDGFCECCAECYDVEFTPIQRGIRRHIIN